MSLMKLESVICIYKSTREERGREREFRSIVTALSQIHVDELLAVLSLSLLDAVCIATASVASLPLSPPPPGLMVSSSRHLVSE